MHVFALKMNNFVKPKKIYKLNKLKHQNIAQYCPICIIQDFWCIICQKIALSWLEQKKKNEKKSIILEALFSEKASTCFLRTKNFCVFYVAFPSCLANLI